jgi:hypothetical protein
VLKACKKSYWGTLVGLYGVLAEKLEILTILYEWPRWQVWKLSSKFKEKMCKMSFYAN